MKTITPVFASLLLASLWACQGEGQLRIVTDSAPVGTTDPTGTTTTPGTATGGGGCGDVNHWAATLNGRVVGPYGGPVSAADVRLEERNWFPAGQVMGTAVTGLDGTFSISIADLVDVEGCWGTALDYVIVGEKGPISGERDVNTPLFNAVQDQSLVADITDLALVP